MEMEQDVFYKVSPFDRKSVDLSKPATSVDDYMRQVIVSRESIPTVAVAANYKEIVSNGGPKKPSLIGCDDTLPRTSRFLPGKGWNILKCDFFSWQRSSIECQQPQKPVFDFKLPDANNALLWCRMCFEERPATFRLEPKCAEMFAHHKGIPPTLSFVKSLSDNVVNTLILHQIDYIVKNGFKRPRLEWLYALLLVVKKPLLQDVIASLRHFTRECQKRRAKLQEDEAAKIRELSLFVAIISVYFGQKDLGDPEVKWWDGDRERLLMDTELKEYMTVMAES